jgi:hypothetical protein
MAFPEARARAIVMQRSGGLCEAVVPGVCLGKAASIHHRRKPGRLWNPSNLLHLCGDGTIGCHGWIEAHPALAHEDGLWLFEGEDPATTSCHMRWENQRSWWFLDDEGIFTWDESDYEPLVYSFGAPAMFHVKPIR